MNVRRSITILAGATALALITAGVSGVHNAKPAAAKPSVMCVTATTPGLDWDFFLPGDFVSYRNITMTCRDNGTWSYDLRPGPRGGGKR